MLKSLVNIMYDFLKSFLTFFKILVSSKLFLKKHKTEKDSIIIMGNGPSLKNNLKEDLEVLEKHTLLGVNNLPSTDVFEQLKPAYFMIVSDEFWNPGTIKKDQDVRNKIIQNLIKKTTWPLVFFLPAKAAKNKNFIAKIQDNKSISISYFNKTPIEGIPYISRFFMRRGWGMPRPHNVLVPSIFCCIQAGFKNIYLIGADHSWIPLISVNEDNTALVNFHHFYDKDANKKSTMHLKSKPRHLHQILKKFMLTFKAYFELKDFSSHMGVNIFNCTEGSFIDAYERKKLEELGL